MCGAPATACWCAAPRPSASPAPG
ncbi:hypothetical protein RLOC_00012882, partial [Lonchura striata]